MSQKSASLETSTLLVLKAGILMGMLSASSCNLADPILLLGVDGDGNVWSESTPASTYQDNLARILTDTEHSTLQALPESQTTARWSLSCVVVGVGLRLEAGLGPILGFGVYPMVRMVFSNQQNPALP